METLKKKASEVALVLILTFAFVVLLQNKPIAPVVKTKGIGAPPVADCGMVTGNDVAGEIVITGAPTACNVTFAIPWTTTPMCMAVPAGPSLTHVLVANESMTGFTVNPIYKLVPVVSCGLTVPCVPALNAWPLLGVPLVSGDMIKFVCFGR